MSRVIYTKPVDVERAFYEAFSRKDLPAMMALWAMDEEIICIQPTGILLEGYDNIRNGWAHFFASSESSYLVNVNVRQMAEGPIITVHHLLEDITITNKGIVTKGMALAMNVFTRTAEGWRLLMHQATGTTAQLLKTVTPAARTIH